MKELGKGIAWAGFWIGFGIALAGADIGCAIASCSFIP